MSAENVDTNQVVDSSAAVAPTEPEQPSKNGANGQEEVTNGKGEESRDSTQSASVDDGEDAEGEDVEGEDVEGEDDDEAAADNGHQEEAKTNGDQVVEKNGKHAENGTTAPEATNGNSKSRKRVSDAVGLEEASNGEEESAKEEVC